MAHDDRPPAAAPAGEAAPKEPSLAEAMIAALEADGETPTAGRFTLDAETARAKMQQFQLAHPHHYVLLLVQAAVLRGAVTIAFDIDVDDMRMSFDGQGFRPEELEGLYSALFTPGTGNASLALQELALAVNAAESLDPAFIRVRSRWGDKTHELEVCPGRDFTLSEVESHEWPTHIHVRARLGAALASSLERPFDAHPLKNVLRIRCRYAEIPIHLNRKVISKGLQPEEALAVVPAQGERIRGAVGWPRAGGRAEVRIVKNGVWVGTVLPTAPPAGFQAVIEAFDVRKTLSQEAVVQDAALDDVLARVEAAYDASLRQLCQSRRNRISPEFSLETMSHTRELLRRLLEQMGRLADYRNAPPGSRLDALARTPLWVGSYHGGPYEQPVSLRTLMDLLAAGGAVGCILNEEPLPLPPGYQLTVPTPIHHLAGAPCFLVLQNLSLDDQAFLQRLLRGA